MLVFRHLSYPKQSSEGFWYSICAKSPICNHDYLHIERWDQLYFPLSLALGNIFFHAEWVKSFVGCFLTITIFITCRNHHFYIESDVKGSTKMQRQISWEWVWWPWFFISFISSPRPYIAPCKVFIFKFLLVVLNTHISL